MLKISNKSIDMTSGNVWKQLLAFALPVFLGELFQLSYSLIDSAIVGRFVGDAALAAVGASETITRVIVGFFTGVSTGCTVIVAKVFGKKDDDRLQSAVHTIILFSLLSGIVLTAVGLAIVHLTVTLMAIPADAATEAEQYLFIYFGGVSGLVLYNTISGVLRAVGDSQRPLYFLIFSSVLNTGLDVVFVAVLHGGVRGAAFATVLSQFISALLCLGVLMQTQAPWRFRWQGKMDKRIVGEIFSTGIPIGLQKSIVSFSNVLVMSRISFFGTNCLAGWVVYSKISHILTTVAQSITAAETTFVSQNYGARNYERAEDGVRVTLAAGATVEAVLISVILLVREPVTALFSDGSDTLAFAVQFVAFLLPFQLIHVFMSTYISVLRGMGKALTGTVLMILGLVVMRQIYLVIVTGIRNVPLFVGFAYPFGWLASGLLVFIYYQLCMKPAFLREEPGKGRSNGI